LRKELEVKEKEMKLEELNFTQILEDIDYYKYCILRIRLNEAKEQVGQLKIVGEAMEAMGKKLQSVEE
jgi:hypothetical protein